MLLPPLQAHQPDDNDAGVKLRWQSCAAHHDSRSALTVYLVAGLPIVDCESSYWDRTVALHCSCDVTIVVLQFTSA
jgi:hypothetical protein